MARPQCQRRIAGLPQVLVFKPRGVPMHALTEVHMGTDAWEALRLCDHEGLDQEAAAQRMGVSRPTLGRILAQARTTVAKALVEGCSLVIDLPPEVPQECADCRRSWPGPAALTACPACGSCRMHLLINPNQESAP